jgi:hypothetical protein
MTCYQCEAIMIQGVYCHETGCPDTWRDQPRDCFECGCEFTPDTQHQTNCIDCQLQWN